jgi:DNA-binding CsgD family transcriptional regulator
MFFSVRQPAVFLKELHRITKPEGMLVLDDGHQRRATTKEKLLSSGYWQIVEETRDHLKCKPVPFTKGFSKREDEVIELLLQGKSNKQIALALGISEHTVEFHLNNVYTKLQVGSRTEAILKLGKSTGGTLREKPGESPVDNGGKKTDNIGSSTWQRIKKMGGCLVKPMVFISMAVLLAALAIYLLTRPAVWKGYTRECEFVDEHTVGQVIARSKASGAKVLGQFGSTSEVPWPAKSGYVVYKAINLPQVDQLFLKLQYSKNSPTTNPILIFIDDEATPRASIFLPDQHSWDQFTMSEPILLGSIKSGIHTIKFVTEGQQFGVADLDKFILAGNSP